MAVLRCLVLAALVALATAAEQDGGFAAVISTPDGFKIVERDGSMDMFTDEIAVYGKWNDTIDLLGWAFLELHANPNYEESEAMRAAGYFEGYHTATRMEQHIVNSGVVVLNETQPLLDYLQANEVFMRTNANNAKANAKIRPQMKEADPMHIYWYHVSLIFDQLDGLYEGYQAARGGNGTISKQQMYYLNLYWEFGDLVDVFGGALPPYYEAFEHCSALVRVLDNNTDIFIGQNTWNSYNMMMRIYKLYDFPLTLDGHNGRVAAERVSFSSYPGALFSADDFYVLSSGMVVQETTIGFNNTELNKYVVPNTVNEWIRNIVANRLAASGAEWIEVYSKYNSGTYNNQNMILDYKLFEPGQPLKDGLFWVSEQVPGYIVNHDLTYYLEENRYFGSYNQVFDTFLRNISGADALALEYGPYYTYDETPRALIFKRNHTNVVDMTSMEALMRYNEFPTDPLSSQMGFCQFRGWTNCTPPYSGELAIACRDDLNPLNGIYAFYDISAKDEGAIDAKVSSFSTYDNFLLPSRAISGPTYDPLPVFKFSTSVYNNTPHIGLPDAWEFPWITVMWHD